MSNQRRTIMGACEYSIGTLQNLKKELIDVSSPNMELNWAVGGIVIILISNLILSCEEVLKDSLSTGEGDAKNDILQIRERFNKFVEGMIQDA